MRPALPWLSQGDIFVDVPIVVNSPDLSLLGVLPTVDRGPAVLLTHDCVLDKTNRRHDVRVERMFFLPLLSISSAGDNAQRDIRRDRIEPVESLYVPDAGQFGEAFCLLSEAYYLPASVFRPQLTEFNHPDAEPGKRHLQATANGARVGRLDGDRLELLRDKWTGYWTRRVADRPVLGEDDDFRSALGDLGHASTRVIASVVRSVRSLVT